MTLCCVLAQDGPKHALITLRTYFLIPPSQVYQFLRVGLHSVVFHVHFRVPSSQTGDGLCRIQSITAIALSPF